jgi:hypothetical protein
MRRLRLKMSDLSNVLEMKLDVYQIVDGKTTSIKFVDFISIPLINIWIGIQQEKYYWSPEY